MSTNIQNLETRVLRLNRTMIEALAEISEITGVLAAIRAEGLGASAPAVIDPMSVSKPRVRAVPTAPVAEAPVAVPEVPAPVAELAPVAAPVAEVPAAPSVSDEGAKTPRVRRNTKEMAEDSARNGKFPVQYKGWTPEKQADFRAEVRAAEIRLGLTPNSIFAESDADAAPVAEAPVAVPEVPAPVAVDATPIIVAPQSSLFSEINPTSPDVQPEIEPIADSTEG